MRWMLVALAAACALACDSAAPAPAAPATPAEGPITAEVTKRAAPLATLDRKSPEAEAACAAARAAGKSDKASSEPGLAAALTQLEASCRVVDAWAAVLRTIPRADDAARTAQCAQVAETLAALTRENVDVAVLRDEQAKACRPATPFTPTGELAKVGKLDPRSKAAIGVCRDARTEALTVTLRDRRAGQEREKVLNVICAVPDLWHELEVAANKEQTADTRDASCITARVWIGALAQRKQLKAKPLAQARTALKKSCKKWLRVDPIAELGKLAKLDAKGKDARALCARAAAYVEANEAASAKLDLAEGRDKTCAQTEGWKVALDGPCATAADRLERKKPLLDPAEYDEMSKEQRDRCK